MISIKPYPTVRLRKAKSSPRRKGYPWYYNDEIALDRRAKNIKPGEIIKIEDSDLGPMGLFSFNPNSKISARLLDLNCDETIDLTWIKNQLEIALELREVLFETPFFRLVHGEADGLPGIVIDRFGDSAVFQPNSFWADCFKEEILNSLVSLGMKNIVLNGMSRSRKIEGLNQITEVVRGNVTKPIVVPMNGAQYFADILNGQKTGLFFDQRSNQKFVAGLSKNKKVLDVFSHVGGFGLAALVAGADAVTCVDSSKNALELAQKGAEESGVSKQFTKIKLDAFDAMFEMNKSGEKFDVVICDPPAFSPAKQTLNSGLRAYERVALLSARLVSTKGYLILCSCSHAVDLTKFRNACLRGITRAGRQAQIIHSGSAGPDHPVNAQLTEIGYLKALFFRIK
jgi:23S rRNA (cytosine1962-C5)-methyltransferase